MDAADPDPVNIAVWGGTTDLGQALWRVNNDRSAAERDAFIAKIRVHAIAEQDGTGPWIRSTFPNLWYILDLAQEGSSHNSVFRGIYMGGDISLCNTTWVNTNVRSGHGQLGAQYPLDGQGMEEGDVPSWFYFLPNDLGSPENPTYGGWGGRFQPESGYFRDAQDTVGAETSRLATVWRWRPQFQNDFMARMDWCVNTYANANHNPVASVAGDLNIITAPAQTVDLDASGSTDPDGNNLSYKWWHYSEPSTYTGSITIQNSTQAQASFVSPSVSSAETVHIILEVTDNGSPALTSYKRVVVTVDPNFNPGDPDHIDNTSSLSSIAANGTSTSLITATMKDINGYTCTQATTTVTFSVSGLGTLLGTTNKQVAVGIATVALRSTTSIGTATVTTTADGLPQDTVAVNMICGPPSKLNCTADPTTIVNDGVSISTITARVCDSADHIVTTATNWITFLTNTTSYALLTSGATPILAITNIWELSAAVYATAQIVEGNQYYLDRAYTIATIPAAYEGLTWIKTANDDKEATANPFLTFDINVACTVYVGINTLLSPRSWMGGWTDTGNNITDSGGGSFRLYSKDYTAGAVSLGANEGDAASSMYIVLVKQTYFGDNPMQAESGIATIGLQSTMSSGLTTVTATASGLTDGTVDVLTGSGAPEKIIATANPISMEADGISTSLITAVICDSGDYVVTTATNVITFTVSGSGTLLDTTVKAAAAGEATVMMQATMTAGAATVTATANGLTRDTAGLTITEVPVAVKILSTANPIQITANGTSESTILARICDTYNNTVTDATNTITFTVSGPGTLLGTTVKAAIAGEATVKMQSTMTEGAVTVTSTADGLTHDTVDITTVDNVLPYAPVNPLCEGQVNPSNVSDLTPDFSWTFSDDDMG